MPKANEGMAPDGAADALLAKLKAKIGDVFAIDISTLDRNTRLADMQLDSLHVVDILLAMEDDLGRPLHDLNVPGNPTLGQLCDAIRLR